MRPRILVKPHKALPRREKREENPNPLAFLSFLEKSPFFLKNPRGEDAIKKALQKSKYVIVHDHPNDQWVTAYYHFFDGQLAKKLFFVFNIYADAYCQDIGKRHFPGEPLEEEFPSELIDNITFIPTIDATLLDQIVKAIEKDKKEGELSSRNIWLDFIEKTSEDHRVLEVFRSLIDREPSLHPIIHAIPPDQPISVASIGNIPRARAPQIRLPDHGESKRETKSPVPDTSSATMDAGLSEPPSLVRMTANTSDWGQPYGAPVEPASSSGHTSTSFKSDMEEDAELVKLWERTTKDWMWEALPMDMMDVQETSIHPVIQPAVTLSSAPTSTAIISAAVTPAVVAPPSTVVVAHSLSSAPTPTATLSAVTPAVVAPSSVTTPVVVAATTVPASATPVVIRGELPPMYSLFIPPPTAKTTSAALTASKYRGMPAPLPPPSPELFEKIQKGTAAVPMTDLTRFIGEPKWTINSRAKEAAQATAISHTMTML